MAVCLDRVKTLADRQLWSTPDESEGKLYLSMERGSESEREGEAPPPYISSPCTADDDDRSLAEEGGGRGGREMRGYVKESRGMV